MLKRQTKSFEVVFHLKYGGIGVLQPPQMLTRLGRLTVLITSHVLLHNFYLCVKCGRLLCQWNVING